MGVTVQQLGETMTAQEFGLHAALAVREPLSPSQMSLVSQLMAAITRGPLKRQDGAQWMAADFSPEIWPPIDESLLDGDEGDGVDQAQPGDQGAQTIEQIRAAAAGAGMRVL